MDNNKTIEKEIVEGFQKTHGNSYDVISKNYDKMMEIVDVHFDDALESCFTELKIPKTSSILDAGCGTGLSCVKIYNAGYTNLEGFEPSQGMIDIAEKRGIFNKIKQGFLISPEQMPQEYKGAFDVVISTGVFLMPNHALPEAYECLTFCLKKGGIAIFTTDEFNQTEGEKQYRVKRETMEKEGKWELIKESQLPKYVNVSDAIKNSKSRFKTPKTDTLSIYRKL